MATAVLTNVPTTITLAESITGWSGDTFALDAEIFVQGTNSVSCAMTSNGTNNVQYATSNSPGGTFAATNIHIRIWINLLFVTNIDTEANDGIQIQVISGAGTALYTVGGKDTYGGGWTQFVIYTGDAPTSGSTPSGTCTAVGLTVNTTSKPRNQPANAYFDAWYFGDGYTVTGGTSGDEIDWSHIAALDVIEAYGITTREEDIYFLKGAVTIGTATTTWFKSGQKIQFADIAVSSTLYDITFAGTGARIDINGGAWGAAGTQDYTVDASDTNIVSFDMAGVQMAKASSVLFDAGQTITTCVFDNCGQVVPLTSTFTGNVFANSIDTGGAVLFPSNDSNISGLTFLVCDNGVEYDATSDATSPQFDNFIFDDAAGNFDVNNTSGAAISINKNNGSNPNSYNTGGDIVTFLGTSVTLTVIAQNKAGTVIQNARVLALAGATGFYPFEDVVTITRVTTTASVAHTAHGMVNGDLVVIEDAVQNDYNGIQTISNVTTNAYDYTVAGSPTTPATGTILATTAIISGLTDVLGKITDTRSYSIDQSLGGRVRKSTSSPFYKTGDIVGTVDKDNGLSLTIVMLSDE